MMGCEQVVWPIYNPLFFFFFLLFFCQCPYIHAQLCNQEQTSALLQFKHSFSFNKSASSEGYCEYYGTSSPKIESWKNGSNCCSWDGVDCDRTGQVIGLDLSSNWLKGTIHPNNSLFLSFPQLQKLNLACNDFSMSPIPRELTRFTKLTHLNLSYSGFSGKVPLELSFLNNLVTLRLSSFYSNDLRLEEGGFELLIKNLSKLRFLDLNYVNMSTSLRTLQLDSTRFSEELLNLIANLKSLESLRLSHCEFHGSIPTSLWNLTQIKSLDLSSNNFTGTIPSWVFELPALGYLDLSYNKLSGHVLEFQSPSLELLVLNNNNLHGTVPNSTFEKRNLTTLILSSNSFSGSIPEFNRFSERLIVLQLQSNNFSGTIHDSFTKRNRLEVINLNANGFGGPIPKSLVNCTYLLMLDLGSNKFFENFPHWLGNLPDLRVLILRSNKLYGPILTSETKSPFPTLRVLDVSNNHFTGPLPIKYLKSFKAMMNVDEVNYHLEYLHADGYIKFGDVSLTMVLKGSNMEMKKILTIFTAIDLSRNRFQGGIPDIIGGLNSLRGLNLSHNSLTGQIPESLGNLTKLEWLDLSSNMLTGKIPQQLTGLISLGTLNLSQNHLTGLIPRGKQFDTFLNDSYINNSALCGPPLSNTCGDRMETPSTTSEGDLELWEVILPGYGFGLVVGLVVGYLMFSFGKPQWLVKMVESAGNRYGNGQKRYIRRLGSRRN